MISSFRLNSAQIERISEIFGNLGLVFFAGLVVPILEGNTAINILVVTTGVGMALLCMYISIFLLQEVK